MDDLTENLPVQPCRELIQFVTDRPGHDRRYAMDISKISQQLGWSPSVTLAEGLKKTVQWYLTHRDWWTPCFLMTTKLTTAPSMGLGSPSEKRPGRHRT
jgi:dTDP-glucose 4,6-dehydratase